MTASFYDDLAPFYHLLYPDWERAIRTQGGALAKLLSEAGIEPGERVHDAACGIGTQAIGLIEQGYVVSASDLSAGAVARFDAELATRSLTATAFVDDLRCLAGVATASMAAVIACDNSIPHLLCDEDILLAFRAAHRCLCAGGVLVISARDYAATPRKQRDVRPHGLRVDDLGCRFLAVQAWEWDGDQYDLRMYLTSESAGGTCTTRVLVSRYYAVTLARLALLMQQAGFECVERRDDVLFQPMLMSRRRG